MGAEGYIFTTLAFHVTKASAQTGTSALQSFCAMQNHLLLQSMLQHMRQPLIAAMYWGCGSHKLIA